MDNEAEARARMVEEQIASRGVADTRVLEAMRAVPRHEFVDDPDRFVAYSDRALPIGQRQTISQPYMVAVMSEALASSARERLGRLGYHNVRVVVGDGSLGWPESAPYGGIIVTAGAPAVPDTLRRQLADGGRLVIPVGNQYLQHLLVVTRRGDSFEERRGEACAFVPLVGQQAWPETF